MNIKSILTVIACLSVFSFALPEIRVTTTGNQNPDGNTQQGGGGMWGGGGMMPGFGGATTYKYFAVDKIELKDNDNSRNNLTSNTTSGSVRDSIKVRGNSTAGMPKKPYRIKFATKKSLFGKEEARSWVLLANWYDGTFMLNAIAFEMGRRMGLEFTNSSQMVDLWINGTYKGLYQLTEQVQSHKGRVDLKEKHNGWLVEFDYHDPDADERNQAFNTSKYDIKALIKWPQLDDTSFTKQPNNTSQLNFVKNDVNNLMNKMSEGGFPNNGYRDLIDLESYAKYVLIQLVLDNFDFNSKAQTGFLLGSNYLYKIDSCGSRIKAGPLWDFDLAAGIERMSNGGMGGFGGTGSFPAHYKTYQDSITPTHAFYRRLWEDPVFKAKYLKAWNTYKSDFQAMPGFIDGIKSKIEGSIQGKGNQLWGNNQMAGNGTNLTTQTFNTEFQNLKTWWNNRINWVSTRLNSYNINTGADITQSPTPTTCGTGNGSKPSSSSANNVVSSSSRPASSSSVVVVSSSSANNWGVSSSVNNGQVTLTCSNLQSSVAKGGTINQPTLSCSNGSQPSNPQWQGRPSCNCWDVSATTQTERYTISVTATCGQSYNLRAECGTVTVSANASTPSSSSSSGDITPIVPIQTLLGIRAQTIGNSIVLENLPSNAKIELYNLQGKLVYSAYPENHQILRIGVQTKGIYIMRATLGSEKKVQRFVVK